MLSHLLFWAALVGSSLGLGCQSDLEPLEASLCPSASAVPSHPIASHPTPCHGTPPHPAVLTQCCGSVWGSSSGGWAGSRAVAAVVWPPSCRAASGPRCLLTNIISAGIYISLTT